MRKSYSDEQKKEIVSRYRSGETLSSICKNTGISKSTLYQWAKIYKKKSDKNDMHCNTCIETRHYK
jgi:transposase-like protein